MYWWTKPDRMNFKLIYGLDVPYLSTDLLRLDSARDHVDESFLVFKFEESAIKNVSDFLISALHPVLICKRDICALFGNMFTYSFCPYNCIVDGEHYVMLAPQSEHICFDYTRSEYRRYDLPEPRNRISSIIRLYLRHDFTVTDSIFRVGDEISCKYELIVGDNFKRIYEKNRLTGLNFIEAI